MHKDPVVQQLFKALGKRYPTHGEFLVWGQNKQFTDVKFVGVNADQNYEALKALLIANNVPFAAKWARSVDDIPTADYKRLIGEACGEV